MGKGHGYCDRCGLDLSSGVSFIGPILNFGASEVMALSHKLGEDFYKLSDFYIEDPSPVTLKDLHLELGDYDGRGGRTDALGFQDFKIDPNGGYYNLDNGSLDPWHLDSGSALVEIDGEEQHIDLHEFMVRYQQEAIDLEEYYLDTRTGKLLESDTSGYKQKLKDISSLELVRAIHSRQSFKEFYDDIKEKDLAKLYLTSWGKLSKKPNSYDQAAKVLDLDKLELVIVLKQQAARDY